MESGAIEQGFEYLGYGPSMGDPEKLVILLHGYGRNGFYMEKMARAAQQLVPQAMILCPHGVEALDTGAIGDESEEHFLHIPQELQQENGAQQKNRAGKQGDDMLRQWFPIDGRLDRLVPRIRKAASRLNGFIDTQRDMLGLQDRDIALMGFSQGAGLALYTAFSRAQEIAGVICHSTIAIQEAADDPFFTSRPEVLYIYGDQDGEFSQERYHDTFLWLQDYTGQRATEKIVAGLGHSTNSESRHECAVFIQQVLT